MKKILLAAAGLAFVLNSEIYSLALLLVVSLFAVLWLIKAAAEGKV